MCLYSHQIGIFPSAEMELLPSVFTKYVGLFCTQWGFFLNNNYLFIFGCAGFSLLHGLFSSCEEQGLLSSHGAHGLLIEVASSVAERGL